MFRSRSLIEAVLGILLFLCLRVPAQAYEADVKCLQEQLREAGLNVGAIDGLIGSRTLRALAKFKQKNPDFATLNNLDPMNAVVYCRELGIFRKSRAGWTTTDGMFSLEFTPDVKEGDIGIIKRRVQNVETFYAKEMGVEVPQKSRIFFGYDVAQVAQMAASAVAPSRRDRPAIKADIEAWCRSPGYCAASVA